LANNIYKFVQLQGGIRVVENSTFKLFVRMPVRGSSEYNRLAAGHSLPTVEQRRDVEIFGEKNVIDYFKLQDFQQEELRLRFMLDSTQTVELQQICKWFTDNYKTKGMMTKAVYEQMFKNEDDMKEALRQTGVSQKLAVNGHLLHDLEDDIADIEEDAAKDIKGRSVAYMEVQSQLRKLRGNKLRLAILGDSEARQTLSFDPNQQITWKERLKMYEEFCEDYVEKQNRGN
jgi:hypothetical protein